MDQLLAEQLLVLQKTREVLEVMLSTLEQMREVLERMAPVESGR